MAYSEQFPHPSPAHPQSRSIADTLLSPSLLLDLLRNNARRLIVAWALVFLCVAAAIVMMRPLYSGTAIVLVDPRQQRVLQSDAVLSGIGNDMAAVDSQIEVIQSSAIARKVIADLNLENDPAFTPSIGIGSLLRSLIGAEPDGKMQYALRQFATNLKVRRRGATYVLEIEFRSPNAARAAQIANAVATTYVEQQSASRSSATSEASSFLAERLTTLRQQSSDADAAVARYREQNGLVNSGERRSIVEQQLADTNQQLIAARVRSEDVRARLRQVEKAASDPAAKQSLIETLQSPVIAALRAQYTLAFKTGAELAQSLGPRHPAFKNSEAEQAAITRQIDAEIKRIMLGVKGEYEAAESRQKSLEADLTRLKTATATNDRATVRLNELEREAEAARAILQRSLARYKETREQEGMQAAEARIVSPAIAPVAANGPSRTLLLAAALFASAVLAILFVAATTARGTPIPAPAKAPDPTPDPAPRRGPEPPRKPVPPAPTERVELPALGYVPNIGGAANTRHEATIGWAMTSSFSPFQEAMRRLAGDFLASPQRPQILTLCGAAIGDGTSTIAGSFADAFARAPGKRVLRFDASHALSEAAQRRVGLAQTAKGRLPPEFAIDKKSGASDVLHLGVADDVQFLDLADRHIIHDTLNYLRSKYDVIVIDSGSAVTEAQSQRLIALSDAAVLVTADAAALERPAIVQAVKARRNKFIGMIVNRSDLEVYRAARIAASEAERGVRGNDALNARPYGRVSGADLTTAPPAPTWSEPRDRRAFYGTILRCALLLNVIGATSAFNPALMPSGLSSIQQYLGVACWIVIIAAARGARTGTNTAFGSDTWALIIFYSFAVISLLWTDMAMASVLKAVALTITTIGAFTLAARARLQDVIYDVNIGLLILNVASIAVVIAMPTTAIAVGWGQEGSWQGVFESKQSLGVLGGMAIFFSGYLWLTRGASWLLAASFICAVICTVGSGSRGGGAVALLSCVSVFLAGRSRNIAKLMAFAPLLIMGIATAMISYLYVTGEDAFPIGDSRLDFTERTFIWQHALAHIDQRPLFGFGINGFWTNGDIYGAFKRNHGWVLDDFHSGFVSILTELGLVGYTIFAICTLLFGLRMVSTIDSGNVERSRIVALLGFLTLAYQIDVTETLFLRSTSFMATLILVFAFNATLRPAPEMSR